MKHFLLSLSLLIIGGAFGWLLRDHQQINRIDLQIRQAILERNRAETQYYMASTKRETTETALSAYNHIERNNNHGKKKN